MPAVAKVPPRDFALPHSPERDALLAAVRARPDDDTPRLVFADWQDEHGQPEHAELIRLQCEAARLRGHTHTAARRTLRTRVKELLRHPALRFDGRNTPDYERGFVPCVGVEWLGHGDSHRSEAAILRPDRLDLPTRVPLDRVLELSLEVVDDTQVEAGVIADLAARPWLAQVTSLTLFMGTWDTAKLRPLARSPHLTGLKMLEFWKATVTAGAVANLFLAPALKNVRDLCLVNDCVVLPADGEPSTRGAFDAALARIVNAPRAARLERLWLDASGIGPDGVRAVVGSPRLGDRLAMLSLNKKTATKAVQVSMRKRFGDVFYVIG